MRLVRTYRWYLIPGLVLLLLGAGWTWIPASRDDLPAQISFNFHIRPILSQNCFSCHGPDPDARKSDLRLDTEEGAKALLESGLRAIVEGKPQGSELVRRLHSPDPEQQMPPPESKKKLTEREIALLEQWIDEGAVWEPYWAFMPPKRPERRLQRKEGSAAIDQLLSVALAEQGLQVAQRATPGQLARRLSYLLTGLPPEPHQVKAFVQDSRPEAYAALVDQLLASPHFGERWARHWMDIMRYAETQGHEFDFEIDGAWRYRDYLIRAFNADVPYDQFVREHLAGDLLPEPRLHPQSATNESQLGTIFMALGEGKHSPVAIKQEEADRIDNTIDVTSKAFLGLTVACARCHDHKFDPIPTADYYSLYGMFESARFSRVPARLGNWQPLADRWEQEEKSLRQQVARQWDTPIQTVSLSPEPPFIENWADTVQVLADFRMGVGPGWKADGPAFGTGSPMGQLEAHPHTGLVMGMISGRASSRFYGTGVPGAFRSPNFQIAKPYLSFRVRGEKSMVRIVIDNFQLIQDPIYGELDEQIDDPEWKTYRVDLSPWKGHKAYVELLPGTIRSHRYQYQRSAWIEAEWVVLHNGTLIAPGSPLPVPPPSLSLALNQWTRQESVPSTIAWFNQQIQAGKLTPTRVEDGALEEISLALQDSSFFMGMVEGDQVRSPIFLRGQVQTLGDSLIPHRMLSAVAPATVFAGTGSHRLDFAEALFHPENPLTARIMANRIWHWLFGQGIVATPDNFGLQGKLPTHPELLDYLALRFIELDWSVKALIREIVLTEAFQRSTQPVPENAERDPENLYLSHFPFRRLEAEAIRDAMLSVSGCLDSSLMGPSVPVHLTEFMRGRGRPGESGPVDGLGRRSIYQSIRRNFLPPFMLAFDMPVPFTAFGDRTVSNVPAQSLTLMNDPFVVQQAFYWAQSAIHDSPDPTQRITRLYWQAFSRPPSDQELRSGLAFVNEQQALYESSEHALQAWADYCHTLFNLKEFIFLL